MPIHDWTTVEAGLFHDFHHAWVETIKRELNGGVLPPDYYALAEQKAAGFGPDVLTLKGSDPAIEPDPLLDRGTGLLVAPLKATVVADTDMAFYRRKRNTVVVRHATDDRVVAIVEIVSPGNKNSKNPLRAFTEKATELLDKGVHLLILDLFPPGKRDPQGIHGEIWELIDGRPYQHPVGKPLTLVAYESENGGVRAFIEPVAVGDVLPDMPLFLVPGGYVKVPLETTYQKAWEGVPRRWRKVIDPSSN